MLIPNSLVLSTTHFYFFLERDGHVDIDFAHTRESLPASNFLSEVSRLRK